MKTDFKLLVNGELIDGVSTFDVVNPATEDVFAQCPRADEAILNRAVSAAKAALPGWSALSADERAGYINRLADAMEARIEDFARLLTAEQGKPLDQATYEIGGSIYTLRAFAAMRLPEQTLRNENGSTVVEHRTPLGVCASITPWNFPVILLANKLGPCLVMGNTMVSKPAPTTPLTTLLLAELAADILPAGVFNVICDQNELGPLITAHPDIAKVAFTGSTATGQGILRASVPDLKRVTLELGGKSPSIICADADLSAAIPQAAMGCFFNSGQVCYAGTRLYVHRSLYEEVVEGIAAFAAGLTLGRSADRSTALGPLISARQHERVTGYVDRARAAGIEAMAANVALPGEGYYFAPTLLRNVPRDAEAAREEIFGPVLATAAFDDLDEAIDLANDSPYGLAAHVFTRDLATAHRTAARLEAGTAFVNCVMLADPAFPFGGMKMSGIGRENGSEVLDAYLEPKTVVVAL